MKTTYGALRSGPDIIGRLSPFTVALIAVGCLTILRLLALFHTPLELYPDEAQYWLWSRDLAFGYFSKPPMVAWLIRFTTAIGGDAEPWVRLAAPLLHAAAAVFVYRAALRLYDGRAALLASVVYILMPAVQLSSGVITTDAPLLAFLSLALWAYAALATTDRLREGDVAAAGFGVALALAALSKYAALYMLAGALLHAAWNPAMRARWTLQRLGLAIALGVLIVAPNLLWNASHHFRTLAHTAANADWANPRPRATGLNPVIDKLLDPRGVIGFLVTQFGVFGPVFFAALVVGGVLWWRRRREAGRWPEADRVLLCFTAPPLLLVIGQAVISRANANWAAPAYVPASILAAAWLVRWRARATIGAGVASQAAVAAVALAAATWTPVAAAVGLDNSFKVARGWRATTAWVRAEAENARRSGPLTAIAVDDRFLFNALAYYGRASAGPAPLRMWVREAHPHNQAETEAPLTGSLGGRVLMVDQWPRFRREAERDFTAREVAVAAMVPLDRRRSRVLTAFVGLNFAPRPRDPVTGLPVPP